LKAGLQLQRCPATAPDIRAIKAIAANAPPPAMMSSAGDWFHLEWRTQPDRIAVRYEGAYALRGSNVKDNELVMSVPDPAVFGLHRTRETRVTTDEGRVVFDLFGDNAYRLEVRDVASASHASFDERAHDFVVSLNGKRDNDYVAYVTLPKPGDKPDVTPALLAREQQVAATTRFLGDEFQLKARRFGDTNQVQLHVIGPTTQPNADADAMVTLANAPKTLTLKIVKNDGRDLHIDLDGDGKPDAFFVHTAVAEDQGKLQDRTHILRQFDADGVFIGRDHVFAALGPPVKIPDAQSEAKAKPDLDKEAPASRAPAQGDRPGEIPEHAGGPGNVREIRIDGDGDRHKELLLRFKPGAPDAAQDLPVTMHVRMIATGETHDAQLSFKEAAKVVFGGTAATPDAWVWPRVTRVADGYTPTEIDFGNRYKLTLGTPIRTATEWTYIFNGIGPPVTLKFAAPKEAPSDLVKSSEKPVHQGDFTYVDATLGEYGDKFRFFVEKNPSRTTFGVRPMIGTDALGGREVEVEKWVSSIKILDGDPYAVTLDLDGDGKPDAKIYDRMSAPREGVDPLARRSHLLTFTGRAFPFGATRTFDVEGQLTSQDGFVPGMQLQRDQGDVKELTSRLDGARYAAVRKCHDEGTLGDPVFDAWTAMSLAMSRLPLTPEERVRMRTVEPPTRQVAADAFKRFHDALTTATKGKQGAADPEGKHKKVNRYTVTTSYPPANGSRQEGAGVALPTNITDGRWDVVASQYKQINDGFDKWIQFLLEQKYGKDSQEALSHKYTVNLENKMHSELDGKDAFRVPAVFTPTEKPDEFAPLVLFAYHEDDRWYLKDITNPSEKPFTDHYDSNDPRPPSQLFDKLDYYKHFPKGEIHYRIPGGADGRVRTNSDKPWHWYLSWIGLGVVAIGAGLMTFGTGTIATLGAVAVAGGSFAGAVAAGGDIIDEHAHGHLTTATVVLDVAQIVGGFASGTSVLGGRLIKVAAEADAAVSAGTAGAARLGGNWAKLAGLAQRTYTTVNVAGAAADTVTLLFMTADVAEAVHAIQADTKMTAADKAAALARVFGQFLALGAITAMSIKGTVADVFTGRPEIDIVNVGGEPVVVRTGTRPEIRPTIGKPPVVGAEGSLTKAGKERLATLEDDLRGKLLKLDQTNMGKILAQSDEALGRIAGLSVEELGRLGKLSETAIAKVVKLEAYELRGVILMDPQVIETLCKNLDVAGVRAAIHLPETTLKKLMALDPGLQQKVVKAKHDSIKVMLDDPKPVFDQLPFDHPDLLDKLAAMPASARADLITKLGHVGTVKLTDLARLAPAELAELAKLDAALLGQLAARGVPAMELVGQALGKVASLWPDNAKIGLAKLAADAGPDAQRMLAKVLPNIGIEGMNSWVTLASRQLHNPPRLLDLEASLDKAIELRRVDPTTAVEVDYYQGKRLTRDQREAARAAPGFDKTKHFNVDVEAAAERWEMKRVDPVITTANKFLDQVKEGANKFAGIGLVSKRKGGPKANFVDVEFGNRLQLPGLDEAQIRTRIEDYIKKSPQVQQHVDAFLVHADLPSGRIDVRVDVK
ncbi:MAG TPA: hypothetical protein VIX73_19225, partial [Kofleriaceae bacterium]